MATARPRLAGRQPGPSEIRGSFTARAVPAARAINRKTQEVNAMGQVSGSSQAANQRVEQLTDYQRFVRLRELEREHVRVMYGWSHEHNTAYAVAHGADYSPRYGCFLRGHR